MTEKYQPEGPAPPAQGEYVRRIQERFLQWRRATLTLSPADWQLIDDWWHRGIPLWIVLESIDAVFERKDRAGDAARARRLSSCAREIEERFATLGRSREPEAPEATGAAAVQDELVARLEKSARGLRDGEFPGMASILEELLDVIRELPRSADAASLQLRLLEIENDLVRRLREATPAPRLAALRSEAEQALDGHRDRMTPEAFQSTVGRLLDERIRELYEIPPLSDV